MSCYCTTDGEGREEGQFQEYKRARRGERSVYKSVVRDVKGRVKGSFLNSSNFPTWGGGALIFSVRKNFFFIKQIKSIFPLFGGRGGPFTPSGKLF